MTVTPSPRLSAHPWGTGQPPQPQGAQAKLCPSGRGFRGLKEMRDPRGAGPAASRASEYKSSRGGTRDMGAPRSTSLEK